MTLPEDVRALLASACGKRNLGEKLMIASDGPGAMAAYLAVLAEATLAQAMLVAADLQAEDAEDEPETVRGA